MAAPASASAAAASAPAPVHQLRVGAVFEGQEHWGSGHRYIGLFRVDKIGLAFVTLREVETEVVSRARSLGASELHSSWVRPRRAKLPLADVPDAKPKKVSLKGFESRCNTLYGAKTHVGCYTSYHGVLPCPHGNFMFDAGGSNTCD